MGAGQSDLYKGTYGDSIGNIPGKLSGVTMPGHENAITPKEKFLEYSLDFDNPNAAGKAEAYKKALGFDKTNADSLISQIENAVHEETVSPIDITESEFGTKYKYRIPIKGINGQIKNVIAVYQIDKGTDVPRMITNYVERKR